MKVRLSTLRELLVESYDYLLTEGRIDDAREKYPDMEDEAFDYLVANQPAGSNNKYLMWACARAEELLEHDPDPTGLTVVMQAIRLFDGNKQRLEKKDLYQYKTIEEVEQAIDKLQKPTTNKKEASAQADTDVIYDDDRWLVVRPYTTEASCKHGSNTTWCIASQGDRNYYTTYSQSNNKFYFVIDKQSAPYDPSTKSGPVTAKFAIVIQHPVNEDENTSTIQVFNAADRQVGLQAVINHVGDKWSEIWGKIKQHVSKNPESREVIDARKASEELVQNLMKGESVSPEGLKKIARNAKLTNPIIRALLRVMRNYSGPRDHRDYRNDIMSILAGRAISLPAEGALELIKFIPSMKPENDFYWSGGYQRDAIIRSAQLTPDGFRELARTNEKSILSALVQNPACPNDVIQNLADLLPEIQERSLRKNIYRALILRGTITPAQMHDAVNDGDRWNSLVYDLLNVPGLSHNLSPELMRLIPINSADDMKKFLSLPNVPSDVAADLINTNWNMLNKADLYELLRTVNLPTEMIERIWANKDQHIRTALLQNPAIGSTNAAKFAASRNSAYRFAVAHNTVTPAESLATLARDESASTRSAVAANPNTPVATLKALAADDATVVRASVASNPKSEASVVKALTRDSDEFVRKAARKTLKALNTVESYVKLMTGMHRLLSEELEDEDMNDIMTPHWSEIPRGVITEAEFVVVYLLQNNGHASREDIQDAFQTWNPQTDTTHYSYGRGRLRRRATVVRAKNVWQLIKTREYARPPSRTITASGKGWWWSPAGINKGSLLRLTPAGAAAAMNVLSMIRTRYTDQQWTTHQQPAVKTSAPPRELKPNTTPPATRAPSEPRAPKTTYKIYGRFKGYPVSTRLKGQAYVGPQNTQFVPGEQAIISKTDNNKLRVKKSNGDHTQDWDPIDG